MSQDIASRPSDHEGGLNVKNQTQVFDRQELRKLPPVQQARLGIKVLDGEDVLLSCVACGQTWRPDVSAAGTIDPFELICPRKCNL
jgi:hypothetical protein